MLTGLRDRTRGLSEYLYRQNTKERADEQVIHGRSKVDKRFETLGAAPDNWCHDPPSDCLLIGTN